MLVTLGGLTFHSDDYPGKSGFTIAEQSGWTGGAGSKRDAPARQGAHGSFRVPSHRTDRMFTFAGRYHGSSLADVVHTGEVLSGLEGLSLPVTVSWEGMTRWSLVEVDHVRFDPFGYTALADYQAELWMPDPFKYGEQQSSTSTGSDVPLINRGTSRAIPRFKLAGDAPGGFRIRGPQGQSFSVVKPLPVGVSAKVDFRDCIVRFDDVVQTRAVLSPEIWTVPGGGSASWRAETIGAGSITAFGYCDDTYA